MEKSVLQRRPTDFDIFGQPETSLEIACGNTLVDIFTAFIIGLFFTAYGEYALVHPDGKIGITEAGHSHRNTVGIFAEPLWRGTAVAGTQPGVPAKVELAEKPKGRGKQTRKASTGSRK